MNLVREGISASPGIVIGPALVLDWKPPQIPRPNVAEDEVEAEVERFEAALDWTKTRIREIQRATAARLGAVEAQIFDPQILMLEDADLVDGATAYIRDNHLSAARAFELRILEFQSEWQRTGHPMVTDRISDLLDVQLLVVHRLLGLPEPDSTVRAIEGKVVLVAPELTPTLTAQLDRKKILGIAIDGGTRTSHTAILARSLKLPAVVNLGDLSSHVVSGQELILDGRSGRVIVEPTGRDKALYRKRDVRVREWEQELLLLAHLEPVTPDGERVVLRANIDLPGEARVARSHGAEGVGLFRTEFLVVGRSSVPEEEEQYRAYREAAETFAGQAVYIRTYDLGGDKFPLFLSIPPEENPFLGWRAIRVCLDMPDLFRTQLRALLRATAHGEVGVLLPLINGLEEIQQTRELLAAEEAALREAGVPVGDSYRVGIMIETPAAAMNAERLAEHVDFFSIGTNDLIQYTLAVDRGNARLAKLFTPFHPSVLRLMGRTADAGIAAGIEVGVCGELAATPLGAFTLLGLGIHCFSVSPASLLEIKKVVRTVPAAAARAAVAEAITATTTAEAQEILTTAVSRFLDLSIFSGRWSLSPAG